MGRTLATATRRFFWLVWLLLRLPILGLLLVLEPVVRFVLSCLALSGFLTAFVIEFSGDASRFPFWGMIAFSGGCAAALMVYHAVVDLPSFFGPLGA